jgi:hypothetical protein
MTPKERERIERMVEPSWRRAGCPRQHMYHFEVYTSPRYTGSMLAYPPSTVADLITAEYRVATLKLQSSWVDQQRVRRLVACVDGTDIQVPLIEERG